MTYLAPTRLKKALRDDGKPVQLSDEAVRVLENHVKDVLTAAADATEAVEGKRIMAATLQGVLFDETK